MQIVRTLRDLIQQMEWADVTVWSSVHKLGAPDDKRLRDASQFMATLDESKLDRPLNLPWAERFATGASA